MASLLFFFLFVFFPLLTSTRQDAVILLLVFRKSDNTLYNDTRRSLYRVPMKSEHLSRRLTGVSRGLRGTSSRPLKIFFFFFFGSFLRSLPRDEDRIAIHGCDFDPWISIDASPGVRRGNAGPWRRPEHHEGCDHEREIKIPHRLPKNCTLSHVMHPETPLYDTSNRL